MSAADPREARLLREALDLPTAQREAFIEGACGADRALLARLRQLLAFDAEPGLPLDRPAESWAARLVADEEETARRLREGGRVGPYRLVREIGRGGMGSVWLAERADGQFSQQVALKLIRLGMDSEHVLIQFRRERALLARLQHPNIAQLIDGGIDARGRPWFAMEHIEGVHLGAWMERQPSLRERLDLFAKLCRAVAHAHRQLIVHRDLKPSNILVQADGEPRLLDFGIAKLLDPDNTERTATVQRFLTRDFAAPELLRGEPAGTSADVYALGLILFELLTGRRYRSVHGAHETTLRPSVALERAQGSHTASLTRARLRGDLDAITLRALADDPARRYPDAERLADDVQRHLDGQPVSARPDRFGYRVTKFLRRNRAAVAVGALGLTALLVASGLAFWQAVQKDAEAERAQRALRQAEASRDFMSSVFAAADPTSAKGADTTVGELLAAAHGRIGLELRDEPAVAAEMLNLIGSIHVSLDQPEQARQLLREAMATNAAAPEPSPTIALAAGARLAYYDFIGGDGIGALAQLDALMAGAATAATDDAELSESLAKLHELRSSVLYGLGRMDEAVQAKLTSVAAWRMDRAAHPFDYLWAVIGLADLEAALGQGHSALQRADELLADPLLQGAETPPALHVAARGARVRALQVLGRHAEAEPLLRTIIADTAKLSGAGDPRTRYWRFRLAETLHALGHLEEAGAITTAILAVPPGDEASYRRVRTELLAARIALARGASDSAKRIATVTDAACSGQGNAQLCAQARELTTEGVAASTATVREGRD